LLDGPEKSYYAKHLQFQQLLDSHVFNSHGLQAPAGRVLADALQGLGGLLRMILLGFDEVAAIVYPALDVGDVRLLLGTSSIARFGPGYRAIEWYCL